MPVPRRRAGRPAQAHPGRARAAVRRGPARAVHPAPGEGQPVQAVRRGPAQAVHPAPGRARSGAGRRVANRLRHECGLLERRRRADPLVIGGGDRGGQRQRSRSKHTGDRGHAKRLADVLQHRSFRGARAEASPAIWAWCRFSGELLLRAVPSRSGTTAGASSRSGLEPGGRTAASSPSVAPAHTRVRGFGSSCGFSGRHGPYETALHSSFRDAPPFRRSKAAITASQLIDFPGQSGVFR